MPHAFLRQADKAGKDCITLQGCAGQRALSRVYSNLPEATVYSGPQDQERIKRITLRTIRQKFLKGEPLSMVTAYDYPSAVHVSHPCLC